MQALTLYLVWDEEAELSEEDQVLTSLLTGSDEDSDDEGCQKVAVSRGKATKTKAKKAESEEDTNHDDDESEDNTGCWRFASNSKCSSTINAAILIHIPGATLSGWVIEYEF